MKKKLQNPMWLCLLPLLLLVACGDKRRQREAEIDEFLETDFVEPDIYFDQALSYFEEGDMAEAASSLSEVPDFLRTLVFAEDSVHKYLLFEASSKIEQLRQEVAAGNITDERMLYDVFAQVDQAIAEYHLTIVEEFYWMGGDKKEGLERLYRALARIEYAMDYNEFELSSGDENRLEGIREEIMKAQRSSPELWKKVDQLINDMLAKNEPGR